MDVRRAQLSDPNGDDRRLWEAYVQRSTESTFYHTLPWLDAIERTFKHHPRHLIACRDGEPVGIFPMYEMHSFLAGTILVSVPYAVYGGALADDRQVCDALFEETERIRQQTAARYVDVRSIKAAWPQLPTVQRYASFVKQLPQRAEEVLPSFPRKARAEARKARQRHDVQERFDAGQLQVVWRLYSKSMRRLGSPNMPFRFLKALAEAAPDRCLVSTVLHQERPIAGLLSFIHKQTIMPYYSGCEPVANTIGANNVLYVSLMEQAVDLGLTRFDFGRTRYDNPGSFNFKKNQGFEPSTLEYQFLLTRGQTLPNLTPSNRRFRLAQRIWKWLPLTVTRPMGSWLSSAIPG